MRFLTISLLLLAMACPLMAQSPFDKILPDEGKALGYVQHNEAGKWIVFSDQFKPIQPTVVMDGKAIFWQGDPGEYAVIFMAPGDTIQPLVDTITLTGGGGPDPPPPPPPGEDKQIVMFYVGQKLDNMSQAQRDLLTSLVVHKKLAEAGHVVRAVLTKEAIRESVSEEYKSFVEAVIGDPLPRIAIAPKGGGKVTDHPLPEDYGALIELLSGE